MADEQNNVQTLKVVDERRANELKEALCGITEGVPDEIALAALADHVALICNGKDDDTAKAMFNAFYDRVYWQVGEFWVKLDKPKPDSVTPFTPDTDPAS